MPNPSHHQTNKLQFADDASQWAVSKNIDQAVKYLQRDLDKLARWCAKWRIKLNPEKTKVIIFSKSRFAIRAEPALSLCSKLLSYYPHIKFLGITFDNRMTFTKHFEEILERCNQKFHRLRILVNKKWGPSPDTILQIYKQCVRPIFEYGIVSTITVSETVITKIQRVQNSSIRLALHLPKYVSARLLYEPYILYILFLIYVNDIPNPSHHQTNKLQFADDASQWAVSKNIDQAVKYLQRDLDKLARWCAKWRIKLNPEKTKVIIFSKSRFAIRAEPALSLCSKLLSYYPHIKFLGITFDNRMTFTKHFEEILERCNQKFHRLRILVNKKWGPSPDTILQIYKQCVRPIFEYGIVSTITVSETVITKIQRVQNSSIRLALHLPKYVSARLLYEPWGLPYVRERLIFVGQNHLARMHANPLVEHTINSAMTNKAWASTKHQYPSLNHQTDQLTPTARCRKMR